MMNKFRFTLYPPIIVVFSEQQQPNKTKQTMSARVRPLNNYYSIMNELLLQTTIMCKYQFVLLFIIRIIIIVQKQTKQTYKNKTTTTIITNL